MIEEVSETFRAKDRRDNIIVSYANALPESIQIDAGRITQVLYNLLNNAIKYSPQGNTINLQTVTDVKKVTVSITDQGAGMTPDQVEHMFDRFYRADSENSATSGLGLGMSIVKQIIADHGGEVFVSSQLGQGTTVAFTLPIR